jgi:putative hemolysin
MLDFVSLAERWLMDPLKRACQAIPDTGDAYFSELLRNFDIGYTCPAQDLQRIPKTGPLLVVANHPFGLAEGIVLGALLASVRSDVRLLANSILASVPGLDGWIIPVNPFGGPGAVQENRTPVRRSIGWLGQGGVLVVFPAGEVSTVQFPELRITDRAWTSNVARLSRLTRASVLPIFVHGSNSPAFHMAGLVHPVLRTALLPREFLNKAGTDIKISIGAPIPADRVAAAPDPTAYVRGRTLLLEARAQKKAMWNGFTLVRPEPVIAPIETEAIAAEIRSLPPDQVLVRHGEFRVCVADAVQIPIALREIGRLRELTFRQEGEGTGRPLDLDAFDRHYQHLFVWNDESREIAGAYRLAKTDRVIDSLGVRGLYTGTLFRLAPAFYRSIHPAIELGRSFVRPEYQKSFAPLLLLWKGIGHCVARDHRYRTLFGPVSISRDYTSSSRALIVAYVKSKCANQPLAAHIKPRKPFKTQWTDQYDSAGFSALLSNLDELSEVVADIEPDHKKLPILLRHYLNLGGQILDFSVDRKFSNVLDGLVVLDLVQVSQRQLDRYMGSQNAAAFLHTHATSTAA